MRIKLTSSLSLYLDVWVPPNATSTSNLPVKVWIYGGGEQGGGIQNPMYDGCNLAAHDTLLVSINYRLGPLGFLTLASAGIAGNFGIQDLVLGLEWVQSHITAFGGNPVSFSTSFPDSFLEIMLTVFQQEKVLLFGESAGASNTFLISTLPNVTSLINAAVWESGAGPQLATPAVANTLGTAFATRLNCSTADVSTHLSFLVSSANKSANHPTRLLALDQYQHRPYKQLHPRHRMQLSTAVSTLLTSNRTSMVLQFPRSPGPLAQRFP